MARKTEVGEAVIKLSFDDSELGKGLKKVGSIAKTSGKLIAAGIGAASVAVAGLGASAVKAYSEFEQLSGGVESMFGGMEQGSEQINKVMEMSGDAWKNLTMSSNDYMTSFMKTYPLIAADIEDQNQAIEYTQRLLTLNSDLANTFGYDMETAANAVNWALKGNYSYLDNLNIGIKGTKEGFMEAAKAVGYTDAQLENLTSSDILNVLEQSADKFGVLGKTAAEAGKTIQGSFNQFKAAIENLKTGIADPNADIGQLINNLVESIVGNGGDSLGLLGNLEPAIENALKGIAKIIQKSVPRLLEIIPNLIAKTLPGILEDAVVLFNGILNYLPQLTQTLIDLLSQLAMTLIPQIPLILKAVIDSILGVIMTLAQPENMQLILQVAVELLSGIIQALPYILQALAEALPDIIASIVAFLLDPTTWVMILDAAIQLFMALVSAVPQIFHALLSAFVNLFSDLWDKLKNVFQNFATNFGQAISNMFKHVINNVLAFIEGFLNTPVRAINGLIDAINSIPGVDIGKLPEFHFGRLAEGGYARGASLNLIGEEGKEAVIPLERNTDNWAGLLARTLANEFSEQGLGTDGGITIYMTNEINNELDADEIGRRLLTSIRRAA